MPYYPPAGTGGGGGSPGGGSGGGGTAARETVTFVTSALTDGAIENKLVAIAKSYSLLKIVTSKPARVRVYQTATGRGADSLRPIGGDPPASVGCVLDYLSTAQKLSSALAPAAVGSNMEASPSANIPVAVTAIGAGAVTVTLTFVRLE